MNLTATDAAQLRGLSVRSVNAVYQRIRVRLARQCTAQFPFSGELEADESYFGPKSASEANASVAQVKKPSSLACSSGGDYVYAEIVPNAPKPRCKLSSAAKLTPIASSTPMAGIALERLDAVETS